VRVIEARAPLLAVVAMASSSDSSFARMLAASWQRHHRLISDLRGPLEGFAVALDVAADAVVTQKLVVIGAAVALAAEVAATQAEALVTFGLAEAEVPAEVAIARLAVKAALQELEGQLLDGRGRPPSRHADLGAELGQQSQATGNPLRLDQ
jgi:hypothetical protein